MTALDGALAVLDASRLGDVRLLVSELVFNAVRHGGRTGTPVLVSVRTRPWGLRMEVSDADVGFDPRDLSEPMPTRAGGRGLPLVAALADRWGVDCGEETTVWFELDRPLSARQPEAGRGQASVTAPE